ncbi:LRRN4 C-terminal-like protein [Pseudorasbora parva]|uniref:LRRN4 C-terminal-like protein n=1 Tax=Pseudorasbora parva TaxID=51549 RepID=UPI00351EE624
MLKGRAVPSINIHGRALKAGEIMLVCLRPVNLLLLINFLALSSSYSLNATQPRSPPSGEDYNNFEDPTTRPPSSTPTVSESPELDSCHYDMCIEQQQTCKALSEVTPCLCPGLTEQFQPPIAPDRVHLTQLDDKRVEVHWCAPGSVVTHYIVLVKGKEDRRIPVEERKRATILQDMAAYDVVCVLAVNHGGSSTEDGQSCDIFEPQHSDSGLALKLGIIGGVVGLIVLLILALLLWRHKIRRKSTARNEMGGVM